MEKPLSNDKILYGNIINGRAIADRLFTDITAQVKELKFQPLLCDVVAGSDPVSLSYVGIKEKKARLCGFDFSLVHLPNGNEEQIIQAIRGEQRKDNLCGLIAQLPLPAGINAAEVLHSIEPEVDVDLINPESTANYYNNESELIPPTPGAIAHILDLLPIDLSVESFLVLGQGDLVGKPVAHLLRTRGYDVVVADSNTADKDRLLKEATVIITGVGKAGVLRGDHISDGVVVIDAGTSESGGSIQGDVDFDTVAPKARYITPSPGGVGPVTVAKLLENVLTVAKNKL